MKKGKGKWKKIANKNGVKGLKIAPSHYDIWTGNIEIDNISWTYSMAMLDLVSGRDLSHSYKQLGWKQAEHLAPQIYIN